MNYNVIYGIILHNREVFKLDNYYTPQEVADKLKLNVRTLYKWIREEQIKAIKIGGVWRISETEISRLLNGHSPE